MAAIESKFILLIYYSDILLCLDRTTLARWRAAKEVESGDKERRPYLASECHELPKCEKFRLEIIREISKKVAQIQNGKVTTNLLQLPHSPLTHHCSRSG